MIKSISVILLALIFIFIIITEKIKVKENFLINLKNEWPFDYNKCFIINLSNTEEGDRRWNVIKNTSGLNKINKFEAVNGNKINKNNFTDQVALEWDYGKWKNKESEMIPLTNGEIGCSLSHLNLWKKLLKMNSNYIVVYEDDAINISDDYNEKVKSIMNEVPPDWDIILIGFFLNKGDIGYKVSKNIYKVKDFVLLHNYIISKKGVKKIMDLLPINAPIDTWLSLISDKINIYRHNYLKKGRLSSRLIRQKRLKKQIKNTNNW